MKRFLLLLGMFPFLMFAQDPYEAQLLFNWDDSTIVGTTWYNNAYNEVWGFVANDREIAVIGSTSGTHFFDVTDPNNVVELDEQFLPGADNGPHIIHRDYHDYQCYLYAVADEGNSTLQIVDLSNMPNSRSVVYDSGALFERAHNIFIDTATAKLYACAVGGDGFYDRLRVYSLDDPINPVLLASYGVLDGVSIPTIHDIYVKDDIAYLNGSFQGMFIVDFSNMVSPQILTHLSTYPDQGYNHSGWLSEDGNYYFMADETHGYDIKVIDVSDPTDIEVVGTFNAESPEANSIAHNLIVRGDFLYTSYYYDGLQIFDISDPLNPRRAVYYDTYPDLNVGSYEGAWGIFPYLPSGNILVSDMQSGLYVFEKIDNTIAGLMPPAGSSMNCSSLPTSVHNELEEIESVKIYPLPFTSRINIEFNSLTQDEINVEIIDLHGRVVFPVGSFDTIQGLNDLSVDIPQNLSSGMYIVQIRNQDGIYSQKIVKQ